MPASGSRVHSEYSLCTAAIGCTAWARRSVAGETSQRPIAPILPSSISLASVPMDASIGVSSAIRCM